MFSYKVILLSRKLTLCIQSAIHNADLSSPRFVLRTDRFQQPGNRKFGTFRTVPAVKRRSAKRPLTVFRRQLWNIDFATVYVSMCMCVLSVTGSIFSEIHPSDSSFTHCLSHVCANKNVNFKKFISFIGNCMVNKGPLRKSNNTNRNS